MIYALLVFLLPLTLFRLTESKVARIHLFLLSFSARARSCSFVVFVILRAEIRKESRIIEHVPNSLLVQRKHSEEFDNYKNETRHYDSFKTARTNFF